jgi:hypothetical protein
MLIRGSVSSLSIDISPSAIVWAVVLVSIDTIKRHSFGPLAHIGKKVFKYLPSVTDFNSSCSVSIKSLVFGIITSTAHVLPRNPRWRQGHSMSGHGNAMALATEASARSHQPPLKRITANFFGLAAVAAAKPAQILALRFSQSNNDKVSETLSSKTIRRHHSHKITCEGR